MVGNKTTICIAGKNQCAIDVLDYLISNYRNKVSLLALPNKSDSNKDTWQKSFKKFAISKKIKLIKLKDLYKIRNLYLFSIEYEKILKINNSFWPAHNNIGLANFELGLDISLAAFIKYLYSAPAKS